MTVTTRDQSAAWSVSDLKSDRRWVFRLDQCAQRDLRTALDKAQDPGKTLFDYRRSDFDPGAAWPVIDAALNEVKRGRGVALIGGFPRAGVSEKDFELLTWFMGLHAGVARPQGSASQYISAVQDAGTTYRSAGGRGYSSNAALDFHTDSADIVFLSCYNKAASGGMSITTSSLMAYEVMASEHPELITWLHRPIHFSRQGEQAPDEAPSCLQPVFAEVDGRLFSRWNWNRVNSAQQLPGVPRLDPEHRRALDVFDAIVRRPELAHTMWLEPGDIQIVNSHLTLHSRTDFVDYDEPGRKRLLYRLWLAPPDSVRLPQSWRDLYRAVEPATVRGGIRGQHHDERCKAFEQRQADELGMRVPAAL